MRVIVALFLAAIHLTTSAVPAIAQQSIDEASISGRVVDPTGGAVPDAEVTARNTGTNVTGRLVTDAEGRFRFASLRIGQYEVRVRKPGFSDAAALLTLTAGAAFELPVMLEIGGLSASVTVAGRTDTLEAARSQIGATVSQAEIDALPLNGRNFLDIALLVPGVSPTNAASTQLFPETSAVPGVSLSVASQRNLSNNFVVDGLSANDDAAALSGITYATDAIEQMQVVTSGAQAQLGRALAGYINVVTKSGTNTLRGNVYGFVRDDLFNAPNSLSGTTLPMSQVQYGVSVGGPVVRDRTFYFVNTEQRRLEQTGLVTIAPESVDIINGRLASTGYRGPLVSTGEYSNPVHSTNILAKLEHQFSGRNQTGLRYSAYDVTSQNSRGAGGLNAPSASAGLDNLDQTIAVSNTSILSTRTVFEARAQVARASLEALPADPVGPAVSIAGVASFGRLSNSPTGRRNTLYQAVGNLSHQAGAHAVRGGIDFLYNDDVITFPRAVGGTYTFSSLDTFLNGAYNNGGFTQTFGDGHVGQTNPNVGMYAQDEWKVHPRVTLNLGVRYDVQYLETIHVDTNNVAPRVGVAWSPFASRRTVIRGSAGVFYDRVPLRPLANALLSAGNTTDIGRLRQTGLTLSPSQLGAPVFPHILSELVPSRTLVSLTTMDTHLENARSNQASIEVERQLGDQTSLSVSYQYLRGFNLLMSLNQNVPTCIASGANNGCRPNPDYANNNQYSSAGDSTYHGLHLSLVRRPSEGISYRVGYTLSRSMNNIGEFFFSSPIDPFDLSKDWGRSDDDQRHRLVISGAITAGSTPATTAWQKLSHGFQLSGAVQAYSALPLNIRSGATTIQGTAARPVVDGTFIERNAGVGGNFFTVSARLSRAFVLADRVGVEAILEGFNLTNRANAITLNSIFGQGAYPSSPSTTFGQVTSVGEPRAFQLGVRVRF